jgi:hypothetical protein
MFARRQIQRRAAEKQKEKLVGRGLFYKQVTPTGFGN